MNRIEILEGTILILAQRLQRLEVLFSSRAVLLDDEREAQRVAELLGFSVEIILLSKDSAKRRLLATALKSQRWPDSRIARAMHCCERTVGRWVASERARQTAV